MNEKELGTKELYDRLLAGKDIVGGWHGDICRGIMMAYFLMIAWIYPFYAPGGYVRIGEVKYVFFRNVSLVTLAVMAAVILLSIFMNRDWGFAFRNYQQMTVTDWFAYAYFMELMLSYLFSVYKKDALWGIEGWRMGVITQMILFMVYYLFSRYFHCNIKWIGILLSAAAVVFLLGICNRYSIYPIAMEGQTASFISTLGNINWFCGYWSVTAPIGMTLYWYNDRMHVRTAAGIYSVIAMLSGVTQGSESAYLVFAAVFLILFILSLGSSTRSCRFLELGMMFAGSSLLAKLLMHLPGLEFNYMLSEDSSFGVTVAVLRGNAAVWLLLITIVCYVFLQVAVRRGLLRTAKDIARHSRLMRMIQAAAVVIVCAVAFGILIGSGALYKRQTSEVEVSDGYRMVFNEDWGHGRGAAWNCGINAYRSMDLTHKIVGVGADCFGDYVYDVPELADRLTYQFVNQRLTNAHNEQLTLLVNVGLLGWLCYAGFLLSAFVRCIRGARRQPMLYMCAVSILAYTVHNLVSFQQILNAPFMFIVLGIGEGLRRSDNGTSYENTENAITESKPDYPTDSGLTGTKRLMEYLTAATMVIMCVAVAFYAKNGYHQIGNAKFVAYRNVMLIGCTALLAAAVPYIFYTLKEHKKYIMSVTDIFASAYLVLTGISIASGGFYKDALWGYNGWNMGVMAQFSFVLLYLFVSRFGKYYRLIIGILLAVAGIVYGIGILHRLLIDPIGFYNGLTDSQKAQFLSTLGQATWYGSFLAVTLPVGIGIFLYADRKVWRIAGGVLMTLGFCSLVTQNSDSAYFALAGALIVFLMISVREREQMCRFMGMLTLFFASAKIMYFLMQIHPNPAFEADFMTKLIWTSGGTWVLFIVCLLITILLYAAGRKTEACKYPEDLMRRLCRIVPPAAIAVSVGVVMVISLQTRGALPQAVSDRLAAIPYFNWNDDWGNGRGRIWRFSVKMFSEESIWHKMFGIGPDCFHSYVNAHYNEEEALLWGAKQLTNAHNEWLNVLINGGILGAAVYIGIFVTAIRRFFRRTGQNTLLAGITAACVSYMCYNFFCYQQVLCTPFIFLMMGIGEYIFREFVDKTQPSG